MGIRFLTSFMSQNVKNGKILVNIKQTIAEERQRINVKPLLVIDINALSRVLTGNNKDMICGGRNAVTVRQINLLLSELQSSGADLTFFVWGLSDTDIPQFNTVAEAEYLQLKHVLDRIDKGGDFDELTSVKYNNTNEKLPYTNTCKYTVTSICRKYGKINFSFNMYKEKLMVTYAVKHNAFAIIGNSTNFLIFSGNWHYWCAKDLNVNTMEIMELDRCALREKIRLKDDQLPLFATCCGGNYYVKYDDIENFRKKLGNRLFINIANYVRRFENSNKLTNEELQGITSDLFGECTEKNMNLIRQNIELYNTEDNYSEPQREEYNKYIERWLYDVKINCIVSGGNFKIRNQYFDNVQTKSRSYQEIVLPLLQRQMGTLLKHKNDPELSRFILIRAVHETDAKQLEVFPTYPPINLSNDELHELIYETHSDQEEKRWEILCWLISDSLKQYIQKLKTLPKQYLCSCLTLYYLVDMEIITIWEADIILLTVDEHYTNGIPDEIKYPEKLEKRTYLLSSLFTELYAEILRCINIVGLRDYMELLTFDGVYYHNLMRELNETSVESQIQRVKNIESYRIYCT